MRDSINYNLKYFIMRTSGAKPLKNTMRKPSPLKFFQPVGLGLKEATKLAVSSLAKAKAAKAKKTASAKTEPTKTTAATKSTTATKPTTTIDKPRGPLARAKAKAEASTKAKVPADKPETSVKSTTPSSKPVKSSTETSVKSPTMQMKKPGMGKKC